jgi:hypothetical protein
LRGQHFQHAIGLDGHDAFMVGSGQLQYIFMVGISPLGPSAGRSFAPSFFEVAIFVSADLSPSPRVT